MRVINSLKNISVAMISAVLGLVISFLNRTIFLTVLDATYLGISGLFSNILLIFSLAELGLAGALTQMLYKPFAEGDTKKLGAYARLLTRLFSIVAAVVFLLGMAILPFLRFFVDDINIVPDLHLIFFMYTVNSASTYLWGCYRNFISADQKSYLLLKRDLFFKVLVFVAQSVALIISRNFIIYLVVQIVVNMASNINIMFFVKKYYADVDFNSKEKITSEERQKIVKNISGMSIYRLSMVVTNGTDSIIISKFLNIVSVGLVSNYTLILQSLNAITESIFTPLLSSVGNLCATESEEKREQMCLNLTFICNWVFGWCALTCFMLINPFIEMWLGSNYLLEKSVALCLCLDFYIVGMLRCVVLFRNAEGLFWQGKFRPLAQAVINLIVSIGLVKLTGKLWTVYAGTVISRICTAVWFDPYLLYKYAFHKKPWRFFAKISVFSVVLGSLGIIVYYLCGQFNTQGFLQLFTNGVLCLIVPNVVLFTIYRSSTEFEYLKSIIMGMLSKFKS